MPYVDVIYTYIYMYTYEFRGERERERESEMIVCMWYEHIPLCRYIYIHVLVLACTDACMMTARWATKHNRRQVAG